LPYLPYLVATNAQIPTWQQSNAKPLPAAYWDNESNQRSYLDWLGPKQNFKTMADYYSIRQGHFMAGQGWGLVKRFGCVASRVVMQVYREHDWKFWLFDQVCWSEREESERKGRKEKDLRGENRDYIANN
jgi:hypothetical protein